MNPLRREPGSSRRDLHDGAQQRLLALALDLRVARSTLDRDPGATAELLDAAGGLTEATEELRELPRGIHPPVLIDRGLATAVMTATVGPILEAAQGCAACPTGCPLWTARSGSEAARRRNRPPGDLPYPLWVMAPPRTLMPIPKNNIYHAGP